MDPITQTVIIVSFPGTVLSQSRACVRPTSLMMRPMQLRLQGSFTAGYEIRLIIRCDVTARSALVVPTDQNPTWFFDIQRLLKLRVPFVVGSIGGQFSRALVCSATPVGPERARVISATTAVCPKGVVAIHFVTFLKFYLLFCPPQQQFIKILTSSQRQNCINCKH